MKNTNLLIDNIHDYSLAGMTKRLQTILKMRKHYFLNKGIEKPSAQLLYAIDRLLIWVPRSNHYLPIYFYKKVQNSQSDILLILPSSDGKHSHLRTSVLNDIRFCIANSKEVNA